MKQARVGAASSRDRNIHPEEFIRGWKPIQRKTDPDWNMFP
jgi:hypothetical protein